MIPVKHPFSSHFRFRTNCDQLTGITAVVEYDSTVGWTERNQITFHAIVKIITSSVSKIKMKLR